MQRSTKCIRYINMYNRVAACTIFAVISPHSPKANLQIEIVRSGVVNFANAKKAHLRLAFQYSNCKVKCTSMYCTNILPSRRWEMQIEKICLKDFVFVSFTFSECASMDGWKLCGRLWYNFLPSSFFGLRRQHTKLIDNRSYDTFKYFLLHLSHHDNVIKRHRTCPTLLLSRESYLRNFTVCNEPSNINCKRDQTSLIDK